jgi:hypothetical protein
MPLFPKYSRYPKQAPLVHQIDVPHHKKPRLPLEEYIT